MTAGLRRAGQGATAASAVLALGGAALAALNAGTVRVARADPPPVPAGVRVSVLAPMRDEAPRVAACLRSLLAQERAPDLEILVLDDGSADGTAEVVAAVAAGDRRLRLLTGAALPAGWLGKPHACAQLGAAASGDVLIFVDADVLLAPTAVASAVAMLADSRLDLLSLMPRQVASSVTERLVQPLLAWSWLSSQPVRAVERCGHPATAAAIGQFLVVTAEAYAAIGGHGAVRDKVTDDIELARAAKRAGRRAGMVVGAPVAECRMYAGWPQVRAGHTKWLWAAFGASRPGLVASAAGALWTLAGVIPAAAALRGSRVGLAGYAAGVTGRVIAARRAGDRAWPDALAHPISTALAVGLLADSVRGHRRGTLAWKGRPIP